MKKFPLYFILLLLCGLCGCSPKTDRSLLDLQTKIEQLEDDIVDLQTQASDAAKAVDNSNADSVSGTLANMEGLLASVETLTSKIEVVVPTGSDANRMEQYFDLKNQIKQLGKKIDAYDDNLEIQYKEETLSYTDYRIQEREAQSLHNTLSTSEDQLRLKFRMDE